MPEGWARIGWVVDVQNDFMLPPEQGGRLYVSDLTDPDDPGARLAVGAIGRAVEWMRDNCDVVVYTADWHGIDDAEIDADDPDPAAGTYPPHCMGRSPDPDEARGARIIDRIRPTAPLVLDLNADETAAPIARLAVDGRRPVVIRKNRFDVFTGNSATEAFVAALAGELGGDPEFIVAGVSRDVCVTKAVDGLQHRGYRTTALRDATWGLGLEDEQTTLDRWESGGRVITVDELSGEDV